MTAPVAYRAAVLGLARAALAAGVREQPPGSNRGEQIDTWARRCVRHGKPLDARGLPWCAAFVSWCLWQAWADAAATDQNPAEALAHWSVTWPGEGLYQRPDEPVVGYRAAVHELVTDSRATGAWRDVATGYSPEPGDLCVMGRGGHDPRIGGEGHVAIVDAVDTFPLGAWPCIGGNQGGTVSRVVRRLSDREEEIVGWVVIA